MTRVSLITRGLSPNAGGGREAVQGARPSSTVLRNLLPAVVPHRENLHCCAAHVVVAVGARG